MNILDLMKQFTAPEQDIKAFMELHKKNLETMLKAQQTAAKVLQSASKMQANYIERMLNDMSAFIEKSQHNHATSHDHQANDADAAMQYAKEKAEAVNKVWSESAQNVASVFADNLREGVSKAQEMQEAMSKGFSGFKKH